MTLESYICFKNRGRGIFSNLKLKYFCVNSLVMLSMGGVSGTQGLSGAQCLPLLRHLTVISVEPGSVYFIVAKKNSFEN